MPLLRERPHLFRGRVLGRKAWLIIDPSRDAAEVRARWATAFAARNEPWWKSPVRWLLGVSLFLAISLGLGGLVVLGRGTPMEPLLWVVAVLGVLAALIVAPTIVSKVIPSPPLQGRRVPGLIEVHPPVSEWADDGIELADLWDLARAFDRVEQVEAATLQWSLHWDWELDSRPDELIADEISPVLARQREESTADLKRVAGRLGFDIPATHRRLPPTS